MRTSPKMKTATRTQWLAIGSAAVLFCFSPARPASADESTNDSDKKEEKQEDKPGAEFRSPKAGEEVSHTFRIKGRTRNVPKGYVVILFRTIEKENGFLFPCCEPLKGNRSFSETIYHDDGDQGRQAIQARMVPEDVAVKIDKWREETIDWHKAGRKGDAPKYTPEWMDKTSQLARLEYQLEEK